MQTQTANDVQIIDFIQKTYADEVIQQYENSKDAKNFDNSSLEFNLKMDLSRVLKNEKLLGDFIVGRYSEFVHYVERSITKILEEYTHGGSLTDENVSEAKISVNLHFTSCPLPKHDIESPNFIIKAFENTQGIIIFVKDAHIVKISQPEMYLFSWTEIWYPECGCNTIKKLPIKRKQSLIEIVKNHRENNLNKSHIKETPRC